VPPDQADGSPLEPVDGSLAEAGDAKSEGSLAPAPEGAAFPDASEEGPVPVPLYGGFMPVDAAPPDARPADGGDSGAGMPIALYGGFIPLDASKG
jgi:hypothetical protein